MDRNEPSRAMLQRRGRKAVSDLARDPFRQRLLAERNITRADLERAVAEGRLEQWEIDPLPWVLPIGEAAVWGGANPVRPAPATPPPEPPHGQ